MSSEHTDAPALPTLAEVEREHIERVLAHTGLNFRQAAQILGVARSTLYAKVKLIRASRKDSAR